MEPPDPLDELLTCRLDFARKTIEPCSIVIFGASGDLTARKLIPALYQLFIEKQLPSPFRIIGFARREKSDAEWRDELKAALQQFSRAKKVDAAQWEAFAASVNYCPGEFSDPKAYEKLAAQLAQPGHEGLRGNLLFYLSTSPSQFAEVAERLHAANLLRKGEKGKSWQRVVVEKPFGHDLASAQQLNSELTRFANEKQIYRIDHYLGKETVQNILMFRFSNAIFEQLWNREGVILRRRGRCGTWCKIICCKCWRWWRWNRRFPWKPNASATRRSNCSSRSATSIRARSARPWCGRNTRRGRSTANRGRPTARNRRCAPTRTPRLMSPGDFSSIIGAGRACRFICARARTCRSAPVKCACSSGPRPTFCLPPNAGRSSTPMRSRCGCSPMRASRCASTARFPDRACNCARCGCISATTASLARTRPRPTNGFCWRPWPATPRCLSGATRWKRRGALLIPFMRRGPANRSRSGSFTPPARGVQRRRTICWRGAGTPGATRSRSASSPLKNATSRSSRGNEAQISSETEAM